MILLSEEDPCDGCENKVDDDYGRFCDIACGKHSTHLIKQEAYKAQLKKVVEWLEEYEYGNAPTPIQVVNWIKQSLLKEAE